MKKKKFNKNKGILFFITDLSKSEKTSFLNEIKKRIQKKYGETILLDSDSMKKVFNFKGFSKKQRFNQCLKYITLTKFLINNRINVILCTIYISYEILKLVRKKFDNYLIVLINSDKKTNIQKLKSIKKKFTIKNIKKDSNKKPKINFFNDIVKIENFPKLDISLLN